MVIRVRNQTQSRLVIYVKITLCLGRLPKKWCIIYCVYDEPKLHNSTLKRGHICYAKELQIVV